MSSFKKLRLDPETQGQGTHRSSLNTPGASGCEGLGRSFFDSSSVNGGNGVYGRNAGPFRTRYSRPSDIASTSNSTSFSRFSPYYFGRERRNSVRVPLIRARRDESDQDGLRPSSRASLNSSIGGDSTSSATSSTAQRIIETLQNLSTPVLNAGKIRIDQDIKAVQPLSFGSGTQFARTSPGNSMNRSSGPPKMCSSLLLSNPSPANQISPLYGDPRRVFSIPKMVDAATNTDKEVEVASPQMTMGIGNKSVLEPKVTPSAVKSALQTNISAKLGTLSNSKDDNSDDEFHECSSEFTFSQPWSPDIFDKYISSGKEDKSSNIKSSIGTGSQQQPLLNGYKDVVSSSPAPLSKPVTPGESSSGTAVPATGVGLVTSSSSSSLKSTPGISTSSSFTSGTGTGAFHFGTSPLKDTFPKSKDVPTTSTTSATNKIGFGFKAETSTATQLTSPAPSAIGTKSVFGITPGPGLGASTDKAAAPKPFTFGLDSSKKDSSQTISQSSIDKVDAAKADKSSSSVTTAEPANKSSLAPLSVKPSSDKWRCPSCFVENLLSAQVCVCCNEKNPTPNASATLAKPAPKKWICPTCMVHNDPDVPACVCCGEKNPTASATSKPVAKKWRCPSCMVENDPIAATCVCCTEKNPNATTESKGVEAAKPPPPTFKFGLSNSSAGSSSSVTSTFTFGNPASNDSQKSPVSTFKFGAPTAAPTSTLATSTTTESAPVSTPFKFGSSAVTTSQPASIPSFGFSTPSSTSSQPAMSTSTPTTSINPFGSSKLVSETSSTPVAVGGSVFGSSSFQPQAASQPSSGLTFGAAQGAPSDSQKPPPTFNFGSSSNSKTSFSSFSFGTSSQQNPMNVAPGPTNPASLPPAPAGPTPTISATSNFSFISASPATASPFGQTMVPRSLTPQPPPPAMFSFGSSTPSNTSIPPAATAPAASFSLTPNINFGATPGSSIPFGNSSQPTPTAGSQAPPQLFQFMSGPSTTGESPGGRKIKRAARRLNK